MADLLLELLSEEIPARMQTGAAKELERLVVGALSDRGLISEAAKSFAGPRRLTLAITGLPANQPDVSEERRGPRVGAPDKAIEGFLRSAGVTLEQCQKQSDAKGEFYVAIVKRTGRATQDVLAECLPGTIAQLTWPKSMRWRAGPVRWIRPLHRIVCTCDGEVVRFAFAGVNSGTATLGHRFMSTGDIEVCRLDDYEEKLEAAKVVLDGQRRRDLILHDGRQAAFALGLEIIDDNALLDEVIGLVEWPVILIGRIEDSFMELPPEVLQTSMRMHQKFFALKETNPERLSNRFVVVANVAADDGGNEIVAGNERVLRARLSDARFFWDTDRRRTLESRLPDLRGVVFHAGAGTLYDRAHRISLLAAILSRVLGIDAITCSRAALLAKADLVSGLVGEFPELQGVMGRHYALHDGESEAIANAIRDHYKPQGPNDRVPNEPVSVVVALADKIDAIVTLWSQGEKPTGSKDPFAMRRSALGIIRLILENGLRVSLFSPMRAVLISLRMQASGARNTATGEVVTDSAEFQQLALELLRDAPTVNATGNGESESFAQDHAIAMEVLAFMADRLKIALRDQGVRHDLIDAVFSLAGEDDLVRLVSRVRALESFLNTEDGANLLAAYRRAVNILRIEEKRDGHSLDFGPCPRLLEAPEEANLFAALSASRERILGGMQCEHFSEATTCMAGLREPVDAFFNKVTVNAADAGLRENRLRLLASVRDVLHTVADFSRIEG